LAKHLHEKRGITFQELGALFAVREMLKAQVVTHTADRYVDESGHYVNMNVTCKLNGSCGSIGCIGGTMALIMGHSEGAADCYVMAHHDTRGNDASLGALFFPPTNRADDAAAVYRNITPTQMIAAITNFIERGKPFWKAVLRNVQ